MPSYMDEPDDEYFEEFLGAEPFSETGDFTDLGEDLPDEGHFSFSFDLCEECKALYLADPLFKKTFAARKRRFGYSRN